MRRLACALGALLLACPAAVTPGTLCRSNDDCRSLKDGWCAKVEICTRDCASTPCPDGSTCVTQGPRQVCLPNCAVNDDCLAGFQCAQKNGGWVCERVDPLGVPAK